MAIARSFHQLVKDVPISKVFGRDSPIQRSPTNDAVARREERGASDVVGTKWAIARANAKSFSQKIPFLIL